jgi:hypothetical protein
MRVNVSHFTFFSCNYLLFNSIINEKGFQKWIGYADVKSAPVHFYVQRNYDFRTANSPIPFNLAVVNEGNAMNLTSGKFTAPRPGIYFFSFTGVARLSSELSSDVYFDSHLYLNGNLIIGSSSIEENNGPGVLQDSPLTLQSTLNLKTGDQLWVSISFSGYPDVNYLHDNLNHYTHFTGFMLEEEIVASL